MRMAGASSRFGVDEAQVPELLARLHRDPHLELCGLHAYAGTQNFDAAAFAAGAAALLTAADAWERQLSLRLCEIDFGGGFGIAVYAGDPVFDLDAAGARLRAVLPGHDRGERRFLVELGRFLTAPAGVYVAAVQHSKSSGGVRHAVLDGGLHHCAAAAGVGTVLRRPPLLVRADAATGNDGVDHVVGGPLCTPMDQFAEAFRCRELRVGDLVAVLHAGAYGLTYSPTAFLGHPTAAEVLVDGGQARLVRERGTFADALRGQRW
jgi:diaminopimelate decarboxylase